MAHEDCWSWDGVPPEVQDKLDQARQRFDEVKTQISGALRETADRISARLDELRGQMPHPEQPWEPPPEWSDRLDELRTRFGEFAGRLGAAAGAAAEEARRRLDELKAKIDDPETPILPDEVREKLAGFRARVEDAARRAGEAAREGAARVRGKLEEVRAGLPSPEHPIELPDWSDQLDAVRRRLRQLGEQVSAAIKTGVEEVRRLLDEARGKVPTPEHPIELPPSVADALDDLRNRLSGLRDRVSGGVQGAVDAAREKLDEIRADREPVPEPPPGGPDVDEEHPVQPLPPGRFPTGAIYPPLPDVGAGQVLALVYIPEHGYRYAVLDLSAVVSSGGGPAPGQRPGQPTPR